MKPKVFELVGSFASGGSERQALKLSRLLAEEASFEIVVGCLDRSGPLLSENKWLTEKEIPEFKLSSFYDSSFIGQVYKCAGFLRANHISVVHTHDFYTNIFGMISSVFARVPVRIASKRETFSKTKLQTQVERRVFGLAHSIVCNSEAVKNFLIETGIPKEKAQVIYNGVDLVPFISINGDNADDHLGFELPFAQSTKLVTIVANVRSDVKNHSMFLKAAEIVADTVESVGFVVAGEGELLETLRKEAFGLGIGHLVDFMGPCSDIPTLLSASDVCILSSRSEGFSNAILEYMAAGKPVVATRVGGASEAVIEGETGFLVDSDDHVEMASQIIALLSDQEMTDRFGSRGREIVEERFSESIQLRQTVDLYNRLLKEKRVLRNHL
jgi:L-malate glycosyltransferase